MSEQFLGSLDFDEFNNLIENYLARSAPDAISFEVFEKLANESNQPPLKIGQERESGRGGEGESGRMSYNATTVAY